MRERWDGQPLWARGVLAVYVIGFVEGACVHLLDLARDGVHAYAAFPQVPLRVFFVGLAVLDPLVAVRVGLVRRDGVRLAGAVTVADVLANWWGNRHWLQDDPARLVPLAPLTLFGLFVVASLVPLCRTVAGPANEPRTVPSAAGP
ncbi:hypothetical protein JS756_34295 [Streptomyces actuosus]|uniref:DUF2637 domain-containing protein n=1 Tax=Streptomyces actuosus TaxID=1885 RepID=A0ABS2W0X8_STRAS|nr:hypothetical protein [Streptomyces actuosus]